MKKAEGNFFMVENDIFNLHLDVYEFAVYCYLRRCENRHYQCWPSYQTIARMLGISQETVRKKIDSLVQKCLIHKEGTTTKTKFGKVRTGNNLYTIRPFHEAWDYAFHFPAV